MYVFYLIKLYYRIPFYNNIIQNSMQGIKRKRRCQDQCEQHIFGLKNMKNIAKYDIKLSFCPKYQRQPLPPQHTFAEYNNDGLYYTSAFVLGIDKKLIAKNLQKEMLDHQKLIKQNCEKYNQIVFPRPNSKHTSCSVCKQTYKNYYQHIFSDEHSDKIQLSPYNVFVKQLCQLFKDQWQGCAEKADHDAINQDEKEKNTTDKKGSDDLNLDDILEEEDIESNPSRISKYLEEQSESFQVVKQVVMRRPVRVYEPVQYQKPQKVYEDRQSRKKSINFAAFFDDQPKKKVINDHRDPVKALPRKPVKISSLTQTKSKQKIAQKNLINLQEEDPFIIEYNARNKRRQKKSYYYLKKKQREQREQREKQMFKKQQIEKGTKKSKLKHLSEPQQIQSENQADNQNQISQSSQAEYQKYLDDFHQNVQKTQEKPAQFKKTVSMELKLFEEVQKKPYMAPLFESFANQVKTPQKILQKKQLPISKEGRYLSTERNIISSEAYAIKKTFEKDLRMPSNDKKMGEQQQQILEKNQINYSPQNQLPLYHKFKNPIQKQVAKQNEIKTQKGSQEVFNQYEQKIRQYHKQKDYNGKFKQGVKLNPYEEKMVSQISHDAEETMAKINKTYMVKDLDETYRYGGEKNLLQQTNNHQIKAEHYNGSKYADFSQVFYKKPMNQKELPNQLPLGPVVPQPPYSNPHQFYPSYNYAIPSYGYPMHEPVKTQRPIKYGEHRETEPFDRGFYYSGWQAPYYMPNPPGAIVQPQGPEIESGHKGQGLGASKVDPKLTMYPGYPRGYPGYSPVGYPGYYPPPGVSYSSAQRPTQYSHPSSSIRLPPQTNQPNTSININFPMYMGPPYHNPYQYQPNPQRYPGQQPQNHTSSQYLPNNQNRSKQPMAQHSGYSVREQGSLPPYAEYQEYLKRKESDGRR